ncbi:hypothetical protein IWX90DRAFT_52875 [Phyllosticta citrichinensis]|uniref:Uncharacterized protein n=1 Tax=Phyllosticta citrichinensis TaxID=1130410 RepID=A0ABR1XIR5_9PEZI
MLGGSVRVAHPSSLLILLRSLAFSSPLFLIPTVMMSLANSSKKDAVQRSAIAPFNLTLILLYDLYNTNHYAPRHHLSLSFNRRTFVRPEQQSALVEHDSELRSAVTLLHGRSRIVLDYGSTRTTSFSLSPLE